MKIIRKPVVGIVECPLCNCVFKIKGKDWRKVENNKQLSNDYCVDCPNCTHSKTIVPAEVKCEK